MRETDGESEYEKFIKSNKIIKQHIQSDSNNKELLDSYLDELKNMRLLA